METLSKLFGVVSSLVIVLVTVRGEVTCYSCVHYELTSGDPAVQERIQLGDIKPFANNVNDTNCLAEEAEFVKEGAIQETCEFQCYKETGSATVIYLGEYELDLKFAGRGCTMMEKSERCTVGELDTEHERFQELSPYYQKSRLCYCDSDRCNGSPPSQTALSSRLVLTGWTLFYVYNICANMAGSV